MAMALALQRRGEQQCAVVFLGGRLEKPVHLLQNSFALPPAAVAQSLYQQGP